MAVAEHLSNVTFLARLGTAVGCGALIGIERQYRSRMAGLRTNTLGAAGAALFVLYSATVGDPTSPTRVASYVVSGVGFLGGGVILREGVSVRGLNTAATLWCSAAVGVLATTGRYPLALAATAAVIAIHLIGRPAGKLIDRVPAAATETLGEFSLRVVARRKHEAHLRAQLLATLADPRILLQGLSTQTLGDDTDNPPAAVVSSALVVQITADLLIEGPAPGLLDAIVTRLSLEPGVRTVSWADQATNPAEDENDAPRRRRSRLR